MDGAGTRPRPPGASSPSEGRHLRQPRRVGARAQSLRQSMRGTYSRPPPRPRAAPRFDRRTQPATDRGGAETTRRKGAPRLGSHRRRRSIRSPSRRLRRARSISHPSRRISSTISPPSGPSDSRRPRRSGRLPRGPSSRRIAGRTAAGARRASERRSRGRRRLPRRSPRVASRSIAFAAAWRRRGGTFPGRRTRPPRPRSAPSRLLRSLAGTRCPFRRTRRWPSTRP
mmetsp:Transcript_8788/g.35942  ORF Transcript_8788/g.35942 Transcript_8788/m.35942 type:complete len:227 (+) Transcript_8788:2766-3446(+)